MTQKLLIFLFLLCGLLVLLQVPVLPRLGTIRRLRHAAAQLAHLPDWLQRGRSAKDYVLKINGAQKEGLLHKSRRQAQQVYQATGQDEQYPKTLRLSMICAAIGGVSGLMFHNVLLAIALAYGLYFIPLWISRFALYRYSRFVSEELEIALSLITTSYTRTNDILSAIKENLKHINHPVREIFQAFVNNVEFVDPNIPTQIEYMKRSIENKIFHQWCDNLLLCQSDYTLSAGLMPIVNKYSLLKAQRMENDTKMMMPLRQALGMISIIVGIVPCMKFINMDWYSNIMYTLPGQLALTITAICVFATINKAIKLSEPVEFDV